ncbi:MAG: arylesterase [Desulfobacterales bacterium]
MQKNYRKWVATGCVVLGLSIAGCSRQPEPTDPAPASPVAGRSYSRTVVALGDSLTAGLGVDETDAYPARLERRLIADGYDLKVVNAGISGETSSGTLSRINWVIASLKPDIVILVIGANDGMRGIDPDLLRNNLDQILSVLSENDIDVILGGMKMLPNLGPAYAGEFERVYPEMSQKHHIALIPFFLEGVAGEPRLNQSDGIHPNPEGYRIIVDHIYPHILKSINNQGPPSD